MHPPARSLLARTALLIGALSVTGCRTADRSEVSAPSVPPLFEGMGSHRRTITADSPDAQRYFDQALVWTYAFNHDEAIRSYAHAARLDPDAAMPHWGIALCNGPHINNPVMDEAHSVAAWEALGRARDLSADASPVERALIDALSARYADPAAGPLPLLPQDRAPFDRAYADAMRGVHERFPDDPDVGTLYAESLMDLRPWDLWDKATREPRPETPEILTVLERTLALDPDHPGANHLYIHAVEASRRPERADAAAERLRTLVPASGHLVHMPAHIDVRTGRWAQAAEQNRQASRIDAAYREVSPRQGFYRIYMAHNDHFLSYACMMQGRREESIAAARDMIRKIPREFLEENGVYVDGYMPIEIEALMRFGKWDELLRLERPPAYLPITNAFWRFGRASALAALGKVDEAVREQAAFQEAVAAVPPGAVMAINPAHTVLSIADHTLAGEIAFRRGDIDEAVSRLRQAAAIEDTLMYMEPPDWVQPVRHSLGAVLLSAGRTGEAERAYREDLERWPENGWSLYGLSRCLALQDSPEAPGVKARFEKAWANADTGLKATCLCVAPSE